MTVLLFLGLPAISFVFLFLILHEDAKQAEKSKFQA